MIASQSYVEESLCFRVNGLLESSSSTPLETSMLLLLRRLLLARLQSSSTTTGVSLSRTCGNHKGSRALPPSLGVGEPPLSPNMCSWWQLVVYAQPTSCGHRDGPSSEELGSSLGRHTLAGIFCFLACASMLFPFNPLYHRCHNANVNPRELPSLKSHLILCSQ